MPERIGALISSVILAIAAFLEREAGYFFVSLFLIMVGVGLCDPSKRAEIAHDLVVFGTGVLARSMGSKKQGNLQDPPPGSTTDTEVRQRTVTPPVPPADSNGGIA